MQKRTLIGLAHRVAYAAALAFFVFDFSVLPTGVTGSVLGGFLAALNFPVALVGLLLPCGERGLDFPIGHCDFPSTALFLNHLRLAIPVYVVLLYLPGSLRALRRRRGVVHVAEGSSAGKVTTSLI